MKLCNSENIDRSAWDACIKQAINGKPYALSGWLDAVCSSWHGIIIGDYEAVMPVPVRQFLWMKKVVQPPFTQQLGLFFQDPLQARHLPEAIDLVQKNWSKGYMQMNDMNAPPEARLHSNRKNYKLNFDLHELSDCSSSHRRNIKKAIKAGVQLSVTNGTSFIQEFSQYNPAYNSDIRKHRRALDHLVRFTENTGIGKAVVATVAGQMVAGVYFSFFQGTAYYLLPYTNPAGRDIGAMHYLIVNLRDIIDDILHLDFEGSEIPGVETFILGFNAMLHPYPAIKW